MKLVLENASGNTRKEHPRLGCHECLPLELLRSKKILDTELGIAVQSLLA